MLLERRKRFFLKLLSQQSFLFTQISKFSDFLQKKTFNLGRKKEISFYTHSAAILPLLPILQKIKFFHGKPKLRYLREKFYYFIRILRQILYNLVTKSNSKPCDFHTLPESCNWQVRVKNAHRERKMFLP